MCKPPRKPHPSRHVCTHVTRVVTAWPELPPGLSHRPGPTLGLCCPGQLEAISLERAGGPP